MSGVAGIPKAVIDTLQSDVAAVAADVNQRVQSIRLSALVYVEQRGSWPSVPAGALISDQQKQDIYYSRDYYAYSVYKRWYRKIQYKINGNWLNAGGL